MEPEKRCIGGVVGVRLVFALVSFHLFGISVRVEAQEPYDQRDFAAIRARDVSFTDPRIVRPALGGTTVLLDVREAVDWLGGVRLRHRCYNGDLVGPVIRVRPGASLKVRLENHLPPESPTGGGDVNTPHGFNTTNLHTHGLHVSPKAPADDVFLEIPPGGRYDFRFDVPADHPAGTFWYHAHKHGSTALQLASGMAGALIVEGGLDDVPAIRAAEEKVLVLQQFVSRPIAGEPAIVHPDDVYSGAAASVIAVNGQLTPTITMRPGEVQRWRIVHAGVREAITLKLDGVPLHEIAVDGLALGARVQREEVQLYPGYRTDVLVKAPAASERTYVLTSAIRDPKRSLRKRVVEATGVLKLVVAGETRDMPLPTSEELKPYAPFTDADVPTDEQVQPAARPFRLKNDTRFEINDHKFDPARIDQRVRLGTAEKWTVKAESAAHPFHVHVNPFAVRVPAGDPNPNRWLWRDTLFLMEDDEVELRMWFRQFTGRTVLHCHILDHEDRGMMQAIEIEEATRPGKKLALDWQVANPEGRAVRASDYIGRNLLLVFHQGVSCPHCAEQLALLAKHRADLAAAGLTVVAVCPRLEVSSETLRREINVDFAVGVDPTLTIFQQFGCLSQQRTPRHGLVLIDARGEVAWRSVTDVANTEIAEVIAACRKLLAKK